MYHTIEFALETMLDLEVSRRDRLELVVVKKGARRKAQIKPYVIKDQDGLVEVADLFFDDGTSTSRVRFEYFRFID